MGAAAAQALAWSLDRPLYGVNHLVAHVAVDRLEHGELPAPMIALLVSGGHSSLLRVDDIAADIVPLGATLDDAAGRPSTRSRGCSDSASPAVRRSTASLRFTPT